MKKPTHGEKQRKKIVGLCDYGLKTDRRSINIGYT